MTSVTRTAPASRQQPALRVDFGAFALGAAQPEALVEPEPWIGLSWLWRLRWGALAGQMLALLVARSMLEIRLPLLMLSSLVATVAVSNLVLWRWLARRELARPISAGLLLFDVGVLTALLSLSGGAANPFSAFYVLYVAVAALVLGRNWAFLLVGFTALCFLALFWVPAAWLGPHAHHLATPMHLQGMWTAHLLSSSFVAYFVAKVADALRKREQRIRALERYAAASQRLASLSSLAAGAAHELGTPLASIAVAATELAEELEACPPARALAGEARHIREEVRRCRVILQRLTQGAGEQSGEAPVWVTLERVVASLRDDLGADAAWLTSELAGLAQAPIRCPLQSLSVTLGNLVRNGLEATREAGSSEPVELQVCRDGHGYQFSVIDRGAGVSPEVAARLGEPFFTTKSPGEGMGLGVYLVCAFARQVGGEFRVEQRAQGGLAAKLRLPLDLLEPGPTHAE